MSTENIENRTISRAVIQEMREEVVSLQELADWTVSLVEQQNEEAVQAAISEKRHVIKSVVGAIDKAYDHIEVMRTCKKKFQTQSAEYQEQVEKLNKSIEMDRYILDGKIGDALEKDVFGLALKTKLKMFTENFSKLATEFVDPHYYSRGIRENVKTAMNEGFNEDVQKVAGIEKEFDDLREDLAKLSDKLHADVLANHAEVKRLQDTRKQVLVAKNTMAKQVIAAESQLYSGAKTVALKKSFLMRIVNFFIAKGVIKSESRIAKFEKSLNDRVVKLLNKNPGFSVSVENEQPKMKKVTGTYSNPDIASQDGELDLDDFVMVASEVVAPTVAQEQEQDKVDKVADNTVNAGAAPQAVPVDEAVELANSQPRLG